MFFEALLTPADKLVESIDGTGVRDSSSDGFPAVCGTSENTGVLGVLSSAAEPDKNRKKAKRAESQGGYDCPLELSPQQDICPLD